MDDEQLRRIKAMLNVTVRCPKHGIESTIAVHSPITRETEIQLHGCTLKVLENAIKIWQTVFNRPKKKRELREQP